jgi:hypothetical protein
MEGRRGWELSATLHPTVYAEQSELHTIASPEISSCNILRGSLNLMAIFKIHTEIIMIYLEVP